MKLAVLVFSDFPDGSAIGRRTALLSRGLAELGHEVHVVVAQRFEAGPLYQDVEGLHVHWGAVTSPATFHQLSDRLRARWAAYRAVRDLARRGLDWIVVVFPDLDRLPYVLFSRFHGIRVLATYEDARSLPPAPTVSDRLLLLRARTADAVIPRLAQLNAATSDRLEDDLRSVAPRTPVVRIPPLTDLAVFHRDPERAKAFRRRWNFGDEVLIGYLGTYWHVEGVANLLMAVSELARAGERFRVVICGNAHMGHHCDDVPKIIRDLHLQDVVTETGWLQTGEVVAAMSAADILVVPKINHPANVAGMPAKLAEYLAVGRAVICSRVGDIPRYLVDGEDALLCDPGDRAELVSALRRLVFDAGLRDRLGRNARNAAGRHFDYRVVAKRVEAAMMAVS